jgi:chromosome segregation protein
LEFRRLRLAGFKSFVEPVDLLIEPGLTGVVGPNGCGKSNLLEALRWVMGEGSPKSMRSGGMDDVIFAGTSARPAREFATVTLHLAGSAGEEIEVQRRIQIGAVLGRHGGDRDGRIGQAHALAIGNASRHIDNADSAAFGHFADMQTHFAIIDQNGVAGAKG